jgi:hypothetical protein
MAPTHPPTTRKTGSILAALTVALVLVSACGSSQAAIDDAVNATRTADQQAANAVASSVAATLSAAPTWTPAPQQLATQGGGAATPTASRSVCSESMTGLEAIAMTYLEGGRFMVALEKDEPFIVHDYVLMVNDARYECGPLTGQPANRIYCIGRPVPPVGHASVELLAAASSCTYEIPFSSINVPPHPVQPTSAGGYP